MNVPELGVQLELQLLAYTTATATQSPSRVCLTYTNSSRQRQILNPLSEARDPNRHLIAPSGIHFHCAMTGTLETTFLKTLCLSSFLVDDNEGDKKKKDKKKKKGEKEEKEKEKKKGPSKATVKAMQEALAKLKEEEERQKREEEERIKRLEELEAKRKEEVCFHKVVDIDVLLY